MIMLDRLDQRLHAAAQDENYYTKVVNDEL